MKHSRTTSFGTLAILAIAGPIAASGLLACGSTDPTDPAISTTVLTAAPTALRWKSFQGVDLPTGTEGPHQIDGAVATGFDRRPAGAALAAIHATVRMSIAGDGQWPLVGQRMLAAGPGRDAWATARARISITAPIATGAPKVLGYTITRYSPDTAEIEVYSLYPDNSVTANHTQVIWQGEDWRLQLPADLTSSPVTSVVQPPAEMVALAPR
ncbi:hypothetical protein ACIA8C_10010 [Nocardia sp. NPDC051321]|uniref:hypothetical protein n=1 Tax=Nocardia sp. NPDC051321 TaxID=3364323 RepID=UPI00378925B2